MKSYFGDVHNWSDATVELSRLHVLCDIAVRYANESGDNTMTKCNHLTVTLQTLHDLIAALENECNALSLTKE